MSDEILYLQATNEVDNEDKSEALWAKSMALSAGDVKLAKYQYINLRVEQLKTNDNRSVNLLSKNVEEDSVFYNLSQNEIIHKFKQPFNDFKNFPHGFSRSGGFTISQSKQLESYGNIFLALQDGVLIKEITLQGKDLEQITSNPLNIEIWNKYLSITSKPETKLFLGGGKSSQRDEYFEEGTHIDYGEDREIDNGYKDDEDYS